jgi:hypothetical protein
LENRKTEFYDLELDARIAVEVKRLEDASKWGEIASRVSEIPSDYVVQIETDFEPSESQVDSIVEYVKETVDTFKDLELEKSEPWAWFLFQKNGKTRMTVPIVGSRDVFTTKEEKDEEERKKWINRMRDIYRARIEKASSQLSSASTRIVAIDIGKTFECDTDLLDDCFCGKENVQINESKTVKNRCGSPFLQWFACCNVFSTRWLSGNFGKDRQSAYLCLDKLIFFLDASLCGLRFRTGPPSLYRHVKRNRSLSTLSTCS